MKYAYAPFICALISTSGFAVADRVHTDTLDLKLATVSQVPAGAPQPSCGSCNDHDDGQPNPDTADVEVSIDGAPVRGPQNAKVTVVLFSDFACPFCSRVEATLKTLQAEYPETVKVAFRQRPLPIHVHARLAAKASFAAEKQGRFWEYHDVLVAHGDALDRPSLNAYARSIGLDVARFDHDLDDPAMEARVASDDARAAALQIKGTPTVFVNGHRITGAQPLSVFREAIERARVLP